MVPEAVPLVPFLALILWRFVFSGLRPGRLVREIDALQQRHDGFLGQGLQILDPGLYTLDPAGLALVAGELENRADDAGPFDRKDRARTYLRRIVALTGATQIVRQGN